jgi:hypothetical protein
MGQMLLMTLEFLHHDLLQALAQILAEVLLALKNQ